MMTNQTGDLPSVTNGAGLGIRLRAGAVYAGPGGGGSRSSSKGCVGYWAGRRLTA